MKTQDDVQSLMQLGRDCIAEKQPCTKHRAATYFTKPMHLPGTKSCGKLCISRRQLVCVGSSATCPRRLCLPLASSQSTTCTAASQLRVQGLAHAKPALAVQHATALQFHMCCSLTSHAMDREGALKIGPAQGRRASAVQNTCATHAPGFLNSRRCSMHWLASEPISLFWGLAVRASQCTALKSYGHWSIDNSQS